MASGDPVLTATGNPFLATGSPVIEGKPITGITANLSLINGKAFISNPLINLSLLAGKSYKLTLNDGSQNLVGWVGAAGSAETFGDNLVDGFGNGGVPFSIFTTSGVDITRAYTATGARCSDTITVSTGWLTQVSMTFTLADGSASSAHRIASSEAFDAPYLLIDPSSGLNTVYKTLAADYTHIGFIRGGLIDFSTSGYQFRQVLTPSASGITIQAAVDDATENWTSDGGINPNAASFTLTITKS